MLRFALVGMVAVVGLASVVRADDPAPLSGPRVNDTGLPGESKSFGATAAKLKGEVRSIDDRILHQALSALRGPQVQDSLRLTKEQDESIRAATEKAMNARRDYLKSHEDELRANLKDLGVDAKDLRGEGGIRAALEKGKGVRDGSKKVKKDAQGKNEDGAMTDESVQKRDAARQKLMEIRQHIPKMDEAHAAIWAALTQPQKDVVQAKIKELTDEQNARKELPAAKAKVERKLKNKKGPAQPDKSETTDKK